jgi:hypothetical protein
MCPEDEKIRRQGSRPGQYRRNGPAFGEFDFHPSAGRRLATGETPQ